ncbi:Abhydrolase family protein [Halogranum rubrum]|uniref:Abhydrolase family protein n=1 Tax=Halogranum rubrum TaxID=553466 RepID=A0A1I4HRV3_9EURY|nr:alpha/beta fold hydrolase [Halogranum rubrum]SFL44500.1 Abhydrolase family protein [Halogranum rubrum]
MDREFDHDYTRWMEDVLSTHDRPFAYDGETGTAFEAWQTRLREGLQSALGFPAIRERDVSDAALRRHGTTLTEDFERQKWSIQTEQGFRVPFYLLLPATEDPPYPVALTLHGHAESGKELAVGESPTVGDEERIVDERRDIARQAAERGYAALVPDMRAFGELADPEQPEDGRQCTRLQKNLQLVGRTLVGERVWDALKLIEFVERRPALDADRLAVTGHSGGGVVALYAAALDERLSPVAPCASVCPFADSLVPIDHCVCNYVPGIRRVGEIWDIAGAIAPRPLRVVAGADDSIFPIDGTERAFERIRAVYRGAGVPDACELHVGDGGHRYYPAGVWPFVRAHL